MKTLIIGMAEYGVVKPPQNISTLGLGSCIGVVLYDKISKVGGMVHVVLPNSGGNPNINKAKFADTGVDFLVLNMIKSGANRNSIVAKVVGGAHMFFSATKSDLLKVGERNAEGCKLALNKLRIPIIAEDTGGNYGRTIELNTQDGSLLVKTVGRSEKTI